MTIIASDHVELDRQLHKEVYTITWTFTLQRLHRIHARGLPTTLFFFFEYLGNWFTHTYMHTY